MNPVCVGASRFRLLLAASLVFLALPTRADEITRIWEIAQEAAQARLSPSTSNYSDDRRLEVFRPVPLSSDSSDLDGLPIFRAQDSPSKKLTLVGKWLHLISEELMGSEATFIERAQSRTTSVHRLRKLYLHYVNRYAAALRMARTALVDLPAEVGREEAIQILEREMNLPEDEIAGFSRAVAELDHFGLGGANAAIHELTRIGCRRLLLEIVGTANHRLDN